MLAIYPEIAAIAALRRRFCCRRRGETFKHPLISPTGRIPAERDPFYLITADVGGTHPWTTLLAFFPGLWVRAGRVAVCGAPGTCGVRLGRGEA